MGICTQLDSLQISFVEVFFSGSDMTLDETDFCFLLSQSSFLSTILCWGREPVAPCVRWTSTPLATQR